MNDTNLQSNKSKIKNDQYLIKKLKLKNNIPLS